MSEFRWLNRPDQTADIINLSLVERVTRKQQGRLILQFVSGKELTLEGADADALLFQIPIPADSVIDEQTVDPDV